MFTPGGHSSRFYQIPIVYSSRFYRFLPFISLGFIKKRQKTRQQRPTSHPDHSPLCGVKYSAFRLTKLNIRVIVGCNRRKSLFFVDCNRQIVQRVLQSDSYLVSQSIRNPINP